MIAPWAQECLINCSTNKGLVNDIFNFTAHSGYSEHVVKGVVVVLEPEAIHCLDVRYRLKGFLQTIGVRAVHNFIGCIVNGSCARGKSSNEPIIPAGKTVKGVFWVMDEIIVVHKLSSFWGKPSICLIQAFLRFMGVEQGSIDVEDLLQMMVHFRVSEKSLSIVVVQKPKEHDGEGDSDDFLVLKLGRSGGNCVDISHHLVDSVSGEGDT